MKKPTNKNNIGIENSAIEITTTLSESGLLKSLVEDLANKRDDMGYSLQKVQPGYQAIETSSIEAYVSVDITLSSEKETFTIPLVTSLLFTCVKGRWLNYNFNWLNSLS
jgi:hypothetical protein